MAATLWNQRRGKSNVLCMHTEWYYFYLHTQSAAAVYMFVDSSGQFCSRRLQFSTLPRIGSLKIGDLEVFGYYRLLEWYRLT